jgi:hypothetical protein
MPVSSVTIEMGGFACAVVTGDHVLTELLSQRYDGFFSDRTPHFTLTAVIDPTATQGEPLEVMPIPITIEQHDRRYRMSGDPCSADFDLTSRTGVITLPLNLTSLDLLLKVLYAHYLLAENAFFVHACAVVGRPEGGDLFFGPSGSGKSTLAGLAAQTGAAVLADELVIVRRRDDAFTIHGTPFWSGRNAETGVTGLYALSADHRMDAITPMTRAHTLRRLLSCAGNFPPGLDVQARLFALAGSLARSTVCQELRFSTFASVKGWLGARYC